MLSGSAIYHNHIPNRYSLQVIVKVLNSDNATTQAANIKNDSNISTRISEPIHFVICNSCYWCASLYSDLKTVKCPVCNNDNNMESIPISENESFKVNHDSRTGIVLEFS